MNTVAQLISGELKGSKRIKLACGLTEFPKEIYTLADTLEILDMTGKRIAMHELSKGNWSSPNKVTIEQSLAAGSYQIILTKDGKPETKTLVVAK